jgi:hypothetical protein
MDKPNQHNGPCWRCGTTVPALTGTYNRERHGSEHPEGACKTTTKTWKRTEDERRLAEFRAANEALFTDAGYTCHASDRIEHADIITGHGLRVLVGGDKRDDVFGHGVRVYRDGRLLAEYPKPHLTILGEDEYYERLLDRTRALIALIDAHKAG